MTGAEIFRLIGSAIGIAGGLFVLFDRLFRLRPIAFVVVKGNPHTAHRYIRVKNVGAVDIMITDITVRPSSFDVSTGHSVREIARAIVDQPAVFVLEPGQQQDFVFIANPKRPEVEDYVGRIRFTIHWRKANCTWLWQLPVVVRTRTADLEKMEEALS